MFATRYLASTTPSIRRAIISTTSNNKNVRSCTSLNKIINNYYINTSTRPFSSSSSSSPLAGDAGKKATHLHHKITTFLAFTTPLYLFTPSTYTDGLVDKTFGILLSGAISAHSWIGLNYVATDYVPKFSKSFIGPVRVVNAALGVVTFLGLSTIALNDRGGIKGTIIGLWRPSKKEVIEEEKK